MPYISRDKNGGIIEVFDETSQSEDEWIDAREPEFLEYLEKTPVSKEKFRDALADSDIEMIRVVDDLVDLLLDKQVFTFTELPEVVQDKLVKRKKLRKNINVLENLIVDDDVFL